MTTADSTEPGSDAGVEEIQADIERTREQLGETVEALSAKLDVTGRAKQKAAETKEKAKLKAVDTTEKAKLKAAETKDRLAGSTQTLRSKGTVLTSKATGAVKDGDGSVRPAVPVATLVAVAAAAVVIVIWTRRR
jgi:hypothetical protein